MELEINLNKSLEQNATAYFEKSKLMKKKYLGINKAIEFQNKKEQKKVILSNDIIKPKKKWFEKFRWFFSSDNFLVIGGKNAKMNEEIIKNYMKNEDVYFHAEVFGAPHCIIKTKDEKTNRIRVVPNSTMIEAAQFAITFSKAFESGQSTADAYSVKPEQVSKRAPTGTSMGTGAFMIYGERNWFKKTPINVAIGFYQKEKKLMAGPVTAIKKNCIHVIKLNQGTIEKNVVAKTIFEKYSKKDLNVSNDEILSLLPNGKFGIIE
ncbi:MAG: NFACT RNA binding domain-containing protein [Candidatus ainarchaeum sp.]|nr:NFACT RNA binding domain-containing protein [Candidatus ainarchaeum sp.]